MPDNKTLTPHQSRALNIERSISLTANAGSGKTFVLAQRFLQIILNTSTPLSQVAAITFTDKAAGELYKRISEELSGLLASTTDQILRDRIGKIRKQLVSANISTIHSFCINLLKEFPVEASIDANFIPASEQRASELIDLSVEKTLKEMLKDPEDQRDVMLLVRLLGSKAKLVYELFNLVQKRKNVLSLADKIYSMSEAEISKHLFDIFTSDIKIVFGDEIPDVLDHLKIVNNKVLESNSQNELAIKIDSVLKSVLSGDELNSLLKLKEIRNLILTDDGSVRKKSYLVPPQREGVQNSIKIIENFFTGLDEIELTGNHETIERELAKYSIALIRLFQKVLAAYENKKSELGILDFEDILLKTKILLSNESVRNSLSGKYKYLLVDEYQDTNEIQYEIFLPLVDDLKKGNLFIVGDEKQSIYRFRDAELQVFSKTKTDIHKIYGDESLLTLPDSFRMAPAICFFVNTLFKNLFKESRLFFNEVSASDLVCARKDGFPGHVEFLIAENQEANEAGLVAKRIIGLKSEYAKRLPKWSDIAVLVRKRAAFKELQKAFIKFRVPFNIIGGTGFYQKQSISDIYNYFVFLLNDKNDAALIGILRSPFFLVSDADILALSVVEGESYWERLKAASESQNFLWKKVFGILKENKELAHRTNIPLLLRKILRESDFISTISARIDGSQEISNLNKLVSQTNEFFNDEFNTLYDYVSFLDDAISGIEDEAQAQVEAGSDGVNILTIHQAKGLEFPAVFLYKCSDTTQFNKVKSGSFTVDKDFGLLTKVPLNENYFGDYHAPPAAGLYNLIESKKETAEIKRLLYVALTRAADFLFITQTGDAKSTRKNSFAALINEGLNQDLAQQKIILQGELSFLQKENDVFTSDSRTIKSEIPVVRSFEPSEKIIEEQRYDIQNKKLFLTPVEDYSKGEVISATRFSVFSACPLKYNLLYNYKLGDLIQRSQRFRRISEFNVDEDYNRNELSSRLLDDESAYGEYSKLRGQLIHYALRKNISPDKINSFIEERLKNNFTTGTSELLKDEIIKELKMFYSSGEFKFINSFPDYRNEFEVYLKEEDFYLFGILDKLIIENEKLIIVDYKTDNIREDEIAASAEKYLPQLRFYAYIIFRIFNKNYSIEGRIIFIKHPGNPFVFKYDKATDDIIKSSLKEMIHSIRNNNYSVNLTACKDCVFSDDNSKCIEISLEKNQ
jgi:ATP-dependent helicase/nuclease subunit A